MVNGDETKLPDREGYIEMKPIQEGRLLADQFIRMGKKNQEIDKTRFTGRYIKITPKKQLIPVKLKQLSKKEIRKIGIKAGIIKKIKNIKGKKIKKTQLGLFLKQIPKPNVGYSLNKADKLKVLRLRNNLEKQKLMNQIEKFKLQKRMENLRKTGKLALMPTPIMPRLQQRFFNPVTSADIDSTFNADISGANDFWGSESFFLDNDYYNEDFYGTEFSGDIFAQLGMAPNSQISPLLW